jgi:hypothetical protein
MFEFGRHLRAKESERGRRFVDCHAVQIGCFRFEMLGVLEHQINSVAPDEAEVGSWSSIAAEKQGPIGRRRAVR